MDKQAKRPNEVTNTPNKTTSLSIERHSDALSPTLTSEDYDSGTEHPEVNASSRSDDDLANFLHSHFLQICTVLAGLVPILVLLRVSNGNLHVALAVAPHVSTLAIAVLAVQVMLPVIALYGVLDLRNTRRRRSKQERKSAVGMFELILFLVLCTLLFLMIPWQAGLMLLLFALLLRMTEGPLLGDPSTPCQTFRPNLRHLLPLYAASVLWIATSVLVKNAPVWMAAEMLTRTDGTIQVGYVLSADNGWFKVFDKDNLSIVLMRAEDIKERISCRIGATVDERNIVQWSQSLGRHETFGDAHCRDLAFYRGVASKD